MTSPPGRQKSTLFLWFLIPLPVAGALVVFFYPKLLTGDFAEITIESVSPTAPGEVEIRCRGRISVGTRLHEVTQRGSSGLDLLLIKEPNRFPGRPRIFERSLVIYSVRNDRGELGTAEEVWSRLRVEAGRTYKIRPDRELWFYRYVTSDGVPTEKAFKVLPGAP